ncbi:MAG: RHS repeat-associated core domain-containing protein [Roseateles sp.]|uniref:RHS repeat-associated core domain-containing protein n=1 Tax=Roseateles sp. TaxID=1971397 RepID=UPI0040371EDE
MDINSLTPTSVTLRGPEGEVAVKVVAVEGGVLTFITPLQQLLPASAYSLFVNGARSVAGQPLPLLALGFNTQSLDETSANAAADGPGNGRSALNSASAAVQARSAGGGSTSPGAQSTSSDTETDETWLPGAEHRRGNWLSRREHLASRSFPKHGESRAAAEARTPRVADPMSLMTARVASLKTDEDRGPGWQAMQQAFMAQTDGPRARARSTRASIGTADATSLTGQLLRLNGLPLANATLSMGRAATKTDANGEFTLQDIPSGEQLLVIDGRTASTEKTRYGRFEYMHHVEAGQANILPFTVWMSKLDTKHAIRIDSPTKRDTLISNPSMPGLEIVLPAGSVVRDADGKIVTEVTLTPIPVDQPPYPVPYADVPLHYTLQPGGAVIQSIDGKPRAALVRYPNYSIYGPGTPVQLFDYDARGRGWYVYSAAQVSMDGRSITAERNFLIYQFTTTSYSSGGPPPPPTTPPTCGGGGPGGPPPPGGGGGGGSSGAGSASSGCGGDPVDLMNGSFRETERDLFVDDVIPIDLLRVYRGNSATNGVSPLPKSFGTDATHQYDVYLYFNLDTHKQVQMVMADGSRVNFDNPAGSTASGSYNSLAYRSTSEHGPWRNAMLQKSSGMFVVTFRDGRRWGFSIYGARLTWVEDRLGNRLTIDRTVANRTRITSPSGRYVELTYDAQYRINAATDNIGRQFIYTYHPGTSNLESVTDPAGKKRTYGWTAANRLKQVTDPNGNLVIDNTYEIVNIPAGFCTPVGTNSPALNNYETGRVRSQKLADGSTFSFSYGSTAVQSACAGGSVFLPPSMQTDVTDRRGTVRRVEFDALGNVIKNTAALGLLQQQVTTFTYTDNLLTSLTDTLNRRTNFAYDTAGNLITLTRMAGTAEAVVTTATYDPVFNQPLTVTDPLLHKRTLRYDTRGNLVSITDPLSHVTKFTYDDRGLLISTTDPLNKTSRFTYANADPLSASDPLNRTTKQLTDAVGRVTTNIDPLGNTTVNTWDVMNRLTEITDALGGVTKFSYDNNSQLLSHTDAKNQTTRYTYHPTGQVKDKTDPLLKVESYLYEPGGQLKQRTDRKGQVSGVTYDALGRVKTIGFGATAASPTAYTSTVSLTWDSANRLRQIVDTQGGVSKTITRAYDNLDRLTQESTDQGEVNYTYDKASRRETMTLKNGPAGSQVAQPTVSYTWDNADRLTLITQAAGASNGNQAQTVAFQYDDADRVLKTTYTGGMSVNTTYTDAGEVKTLKYLKADGSVIAQGGYTYDLAGRRIGVSGDLANFIGTQQPDITDASYNAANRLLTWGGKTFSYDNNGNMLGDGATTYTWDARDQLVNIANATTPASFKYDSQGRRTARTVGSATTAFNYDGDNFIQELDALGRSGNIRANLITGGIDQHFMRQTTVAGSPSLSWVMAEANNSTVVQADGAGNVQKSFQYTPYGSSIATTGTSTDSQRYTGREDDGTGLYYYRARYYRPDCMRFISEDPIGWASGQVNNYAYVGGDPVSATDPTGEVANFGVGAAAGAITGFALAKLTGECYGVQDAFRDAALGAVGGGIASKVNKLYRILKLRSIANSRGLQNVGQKGYTETWKNGPNALEKLDIKFEAGKSAGLQAGSKVPRFSYRIDAGKFWDPFTGQMGPKGALSHVPLEPFFGGGSGAAGAAAAVLGGAISTEGGCD